MNQEKSSAVNAKRKRRRGKKIALLVLAFLLIASAAVSGTLAYLVADTEDVKNKFTPSKVTCEVTEKFENNVKSEVIVKNTSDIPAYIRVKLVTYRVNNNGDHIGGTAEIPSFTLGTGWEKYGEYYYYKTPVAANNGTTANLIGTESSITLKSYTDTDGGKQVIEVMAEAIQSEPAKAVGEAWGVTIRVDSVTAYSATGN